MATITVFLLPSVSLYTEVSNAAFDLNNGVTHVELHCGRYSQLAQDIKKVADLNLVCVSSSNIQAWSRVHNEFNTWILCCALKLEILTEATLISLYLPSK